MAELVEGAGLENQKGGNPFEGSNPSPSAEKINHRPSVGDLFYIGDNRAFEARYSGA